MACQPKDHFQQLPHFTPLPAEFCTRIAALGTTITQRACNAMHAINRLLYNQSCWCQLDRNYDQPTSTTSNVVDDTTYYSASAPL